MIKITIATLASLAALCANAQQSFSIQGQLSSHHDGKKVLLQYPNPEGLKDPIKDSTFVKNGVFKFEGKLFKDVERAILILSEPNENVDLSEYWKYYERDLQYIMLENDSFQLSGPTIKEAHVTGGKVQADFNLLNEQLKPWKERMQLLSQQSLKLSRSGREKAAEALWPKMKPITAEIDQIENNFRISHPDSFVSLYLIAMKGGIDHPDFESQFNALSPRVQNSDLGKEMDSTLKATQVVAAGNRALDFTLNSTQGQPVSLSSFKGKYVLLDFWASWCSPCRDLHPHMIKVYEKYKSENFEIVAVSMDSKKEAWLKAIKQDGIPWIQLSDLKGLKNQAAILYGITGIPQNFLIDPNGVIIGKELKGEALDKRLAEVLDVN
ncbi:TlpA disulfide reductase family protein [Sphingobacterium detergens]|uniref:Peroxiredoxin n=1 Tax=Sphingobacterium detergens TaxID=1145106 RepID=A0A420BKW8_SPHD1|nr:TlpA disulfide reductase family protein [Sphingobacterium detergens]RKE57255.1 peroxiredoxin [Sphingobacterium detergens]